MTPPDYEYLRKLLKDHSGLDLSADKQYLIESRLLPLARKAGLVGIGDLVQKMKSGSISLIAQVVEAMTTNETFFFRDKIPFDHFREKIMPEMLQARAGRKSIADLVCRGLDRSGALFAGDVPEGNGRRAQRLARRDRRDRPFAGGPGEIQGRHLQPVRGAARACRSRCWSSTSSRPASSGRSIPTSAPWCSTGSSTCCTISRSSARFDVIFCRNVLIYFDQDTKINIFGRLARTIEPDGFLVLGAAETVVGLTEAFKPIADRRGLYRPSGDARRRPDLRPRRAVLPRLAMAGTMRDVRGKPGRRARHLQPRL